MATAGRGASPGGPWSGALQHPTLWPVLVLLKVWLCPAMTTDDNLWGSSCGESHSEPVVPEGPAPSAWSQLTSCQPHRPGLPAQTCCSSRGSLLPLTDIMVALQIKWMSSGRAEISQVYLSPQCPAKTLAREEGPRICRGTQTGWMDKLCPKRVRAHDAGPAFSPPLPYGSLPLSLLG